MRLNRILFVGALGVGLLGLVGRSLLGAAEAVAYGPPGDWIDVVATVPASKVQAHATGLVYELSDFQTNVERQESYGRHVVRVLSEAGLGSCGELNFGFEPSYQELALHHVRVWRAAGAELNRLDPAKVRIMRRERRAEAGLYDGRLTALVIVEDLRVGDVLDYAYTIRGRNPIFQGLYAEGWGLDGSSPSDRRRIRVVSAAKRPLHWRMRPTAPEPPVATERDGWREWSWERRDLAGFEWEGGAPPWFQQAPVLQISEYADWGEVLAWALPLYPLEAPLPDELAALVARLRDRPPAERATEALHYVQESIRYLSLSLGESSHRPHLPAEVFAHRFGDCKDKSLLLASVLHQLGLDAAPALVDSGSGKELDRWLPSPLLFDHVIVHLRLDGQDFWLDPTSLYQAGELAEHAVASHGLALPIRAGVKGPIPVEPPPRARVQVVRNEVFVSHGFQQPATLTVTSTYRGASAEGRRGYVAGTTAERIATERLNFVLRSFPTATATSAPKWEDCRPRNELVMTETYSIADFWKFDEPNRTYRASVSPQLLTDYVDTVATPKRRMPLGVAHPIELVHRIRIQLHEDWTVTQGQTLETTAAFTLENKVDYQNRELRLDYRYASTADVVAAEEVPKYAQDVTRIRGDLGFSLTYRLPADPAKPAAAFAMNWSMAAFAGLFAIVLTMAAIWVCRRRPDPAVPPPLPEHPELVGLGGWLVLICIGLFVSGVRLLAQLPGFLEPVMDANRWHSLTVVGQANYHPLFAPLLLVEMAFNLFQIGTVVLGLCGFFGRRRFFPWLMLVQLIATPLFLLADAIVAGWLPGGKSVTDLAGISDFVQNTVRALIWVPYFLRSRRVKSTFVR